MGFSPANAKLRKLYDNRLMNRYLRNGKKVYSFDLLSGHSCPFAKDCLAKVVIQDDGSKKLVDGPDTEFRCFSASQEVIFPGVYNSRNGNFESLRGKSMTEMWELISESMPADAGVVRIHVAGDFFNEQYFVAWLVMARLNPDVLFYAYTKSLPYWVNHIASIPENMVLTASRGGRMDHMIEQYDLRSVKVVFSKYQARKLGLVIDHDDSHAALPSRQSKDFALLIHGVNPAGSEASKAVQKLKKSGAQFAYGRKQTNRT
jgi:hypothetical protein